MNIPRCVWISGQVRDKASQDVVNSIKQGDVMNSVTVEEA